MAWTVEYEPERAVVVLTASGEIRNEDVRAQVAETVRLLKQSRTNCVLVDYSEALSEISLPSLYWLPDYYSELGVPWHARIAVVLPRSRYRLESYQFFELVCKSAGYNVRLFDNKETAEDWLAEGPRIWGRGNSHAHA